MVRLMLAKLYELPLPIILLAVGVGFLLIVFSNVKIRK